MGRVPKPSRFRWTPRRSKAAVLLADSQTIDEVAKKVGVSEKSIDRWKRDSEFIQEVDRLSLMTGIAGRAERVRLAKRVVHQKYVKDKEGKEILETRADLLDWIKYVQSETDGVRLGIFDELTALLASAAQPVATEGPGRDDAGSDGPQTPTV